MRILITDGDNRSALAAVRSLGRRGHEVVVACDRSPSLCTVSKYCADTVLHPSPARDPEGFLQSILDAATQLRIDVLLPMTDVTTQLLTENAHRLPPATQLPFAPAATIARASDKAELVRLARLVDVAIPETLEINSAYGVEQVAAEARYPIVIKPARSRVRTASGFLSTGVSYAADATQLIRQVREMDPAQFPVLLQERIEGPGVGLFACYDRGEPVALFAHKRIREKPPSGGVSVLRESAALDSQAVESANRLLKALDWRGVAMVEFKRDRRDNSLRLMEINARFWGSLQLAIDAGVDFPEILVQIAAGRQPAAAPHYKVGVRSRWFWGDVDALVMLLTRSRASLNLPPSHPGRWRVLWDFMHLWGRDMHYEVLRLDDVRPWLLETRRWLGLG